MWALLRRFLTVVSRSEVGLRGSTLGSSGCFALRQCLLGVLLTLYLAGLGLCIGWMVLQVCQSLCDHAIDSLGEVPGLVVCTSSSAVLLFTAFAFFVLFGVASVPMLGLVFALLGPPVVVLTIFWIFVQRFGTEAGCSYALVCLIALALIAKWSARFFDSLCRCAGWELHVEEPLFMQNLGRPLNETDLAIERFIDQCIITGKELKIREMLSDEELEETASALVIGLPAVTLLRSILDQGGDFFSTSGPSLFPSDAQDPDLRYLAEGLQSVHQKLKPLCLVQLEVEQLIRALLGHEELPMGIECSLNLCEGGEVRVEGTAEAPPPLAAEPSRSAALAEQPQPDEARRGRTHESRGRLLQPHQAESQQMNAAGQLSHQSSFATPTSSPLLPSRSAAATAAATTSSEIHLPSSSTQRRSTQSSWLSDHWAFLLGNRGSNHHMNSNDDVDPTAYHTPVTPAHGQPAASSTFAWPWSQPPWLPQTSSHQSSSAAAAPAVAEATSSSWSWSWSWPAAWPALPSVTTSALASVPRRWRSMSSSSSLLSSSRPVSAEAQRRRDLRSILSSLIGLALDVTRHEAFKRHCSCMFNQILDLDLTKEQPYRSRMTA